MALNANEYATYLTIGEGKIVKRVSEPTAKSKSRTTKEGKLVHEEFYDSVSGFILSVTVDEHEQYGKSWVINIKDDSGTEYKLKVGYSSGYAQAFLKVFPNVNLTKPVEIVPSMKVMPDGKKKASMFIMQGGTWLKHYYTRENPNGLPELQKIKVKGKETWDDSDRMEFFEKMVINKMEVPF